MGKASGMARMAASDAEGVLVEAAVPGNSALSEMVELGNGDASGMARRTASAKGVLVRLDVFGYAMISATLELGNCKASGREAAAVTGDMLAQVEPLEVGNLSNPWHVSKQTAGTYFSTNEGNTQGVRPCHSPRNEGNTEMPPPTKMKDQRTNKNSNKTNQACPPPT